MTPVHFFSHGSTMMLGEDSASARYWERMGEEALKNGVEHVVIMVSSTEQSYRNPFLEDTPSLGLQQKLGQLIFGASGFLSHCTWAPHF